MSQMMAGNRHFQRDEWSKVWGHVLNVEENRSSPKLPLSFLLEILTNSLS